MPSDQSQRKVTAWRELLISTSCFSTVSPGRKLWSLLVNASPLPAMYARTGWLLRINALPAAVGTQSDGS